MEEKKQEEDEISIDFSKLRGFFKRNKAEKETHAKESIKAEDEELSIDFTKIKEFFKRKTDKQETQPKKEPEKPEDEEISIDLSKIKNLFKSDEEESKTESKTQDSDEELNIDFSKIKNIFKRKTLEDKPDTKEKDEELSIDFSGVKRFLNKKLEKTESQEEKVDISELSSSLNLKKLFKSPKEKREKEIKDEHEESIQLDIKGVISKVKGKGHIFLPTILLIFTIILSIYVRMQNAYVPITDVWAVQSVSNYYVQQIRDSIEQRYQNLPDANKADIINKEYQNLLEEKSAEINSQIKEASLFYKSKFQDDNGNLYMPDIDPYYWFRYARNIIEHGYPGDEIREGKQFDNHMWAPQGAYIPTTDQFYPYILAYYYKVVRIFNPQISLMNSILYFPLLISALSIIPVFIIARKFGGNLAGIIAGLIFGINTMFVSKTLFGHADTDAMVMFFPVFICWLFLLATESKKKILTIIFSALSGLLVGVYSFIWSGWWYIYDFILITVILIIFFSVFFYLRENKSIAGYIKKTSFKTILISILFFTIFSGLIVSSSEGLMSFIRSPIKPLLFTQFKEAFFESLWPNVLTTVAELKEVSVGEIIFALGGKPYFLLGLLGIILIYLGNISKKEMIFLISVSIWFGILMTDTLLSLSVIYYVMLLAFPILFGVLLFGEIKSITNIKLAMLLLIWLLAGVYASTKGIRFTLIIAPAFGIAFGIAISKIVEYSTKILNRELNISKIVAYSILIVISGLAFISPFQKSYASSSSDIPIINDAWYNALILINTNSTRSAIITSWWDLGHHFKALADRRVTFDGASQSSPQAHWVGKVLLNPDENLSIGILRMLNCGGNNATDVVDKITRDTAKSLDMLYKIIMMNVDSAREYLENSGFSEEQITDILRNTHCKPVENFFITSEDMVGKAGVWGHFGSWNFNRALAYNTLKKPEYDDIDSGVKFLQERLGYSHQEAENIYFDINALKSEDVNAWISPWPVYNEPSPMTRCNNEHNITLRCDNFIVNLSSYAVYLRTPSGIMYPKVAVFTENNTYIKKEYPDSIALLGNGRELGITVLPDKNAILVSDYLLADSIFTKLFFLDGYGIKNFRKFYEEQTVLGNKIIVWRIDWGNHLNDTENY